MFVSKFLKKAWEGEQFTYCGMQFDVEKAQKIIEANPRPTQKAPKQFLEAFVGKVEEEKPDENGWTSINMLNVGLKEEHIQEVDENQPGICAVITYKPSKRFPESKTNYILIDGNHRAKKRLRMGLDFMEVYILTPEETWEVMAPNTMEGLLKNMVNPTKKPSKPRPPKPAGPSKAELARRADMQARLDFLIQNYSPGRNGGTMDAYLQKFEEPMYADYYVEEREYLEKQLKKKKA